MELEFDKEIDALLRKARSGTSVAGRGEHLDADAIAAFAEGALPAAARKTYTAHFADCDSCRKALSHHVIRKILTLRGQRRSMSACEARRRGDRDKHKLKTEVTMTPPGQFRRKA